MIRKSNRTQLTNTIGVHRMCIYVCARARVCASTRYTIRNKRTVKDYYGAYCRRSAFSRRHSWTQRTVQTISPTLRVSYIRAKGGGRGRRAPTACVRSNSVKLRGNAWNGSENNVYVHTYVRTYVFTCARVRKGARTRTKGSELRGRCRLYTVADSLGPEDISQRGWVQVESWGLLVLNPSEYPGACFPSSPLPPPPPPPPLPSPLRSSATGSKAKASLLYWSFAGTSLQFERGSSLCS